MAEEENSVSEDEDVETQHGASGDVSARESALCIRRAVRHWVLWPRS